MTRFEIGITAFTQAIAVAILIGLVIRGKWRLSWAFPLYHCFGLTLTSLIIWWPARFYERGFYLTTLTLLHLAKFAIGLEVAWRTFHTFRGARAVALRILLAIVAATAIAVAVLPVAGPASPAYELALVQFHPRVISGTLWLMVATLAVAQWYRIPIHPFHAALLGSFAVYLAVYTVLLTVLGRYGFDSMREYVNRVDTAAFLVLMLRWFQVAWRREGAVSVAQIALIRKVEMQPTAFA